METPAMRVEAASMPDPGDDLIARVVGRPDRTWFYWTGRESLRETERALAVAGRSLDSFQSILDFGCGCGRVLLWLEDLGQRTKLHAVGDIARRALLRLIRPYTFHEDRVDDELARTIDGLAGTLDAQSERLTTLERQRLGRP